MKQISELIRHGSLMFFTATVGSVFNMLYQLYMVRNLNPVDYGTLNSLLALLLIISVPIGTIQTAITKFCSSFHAHNQWHKIKVFLFGFINKVLFFGIIFFLIIILLRKNISSFFQITTSSHIIIVGLLMLVSTMLPIGLGGLQGLQMFGWLGFNGVISSGLKLVLGIFLVSLGFKVIGALGAFLFANITTLILSIVPLGRFITNKTRLSIDLSNVDLQNKINFSEVYKYFISVTVTTLCFMSLINGDIILVKHFFTPIEAGYYSVAQMVGKIIIFLPMSIIMVMFPKASNLHTQNKDTLPLLKNTLGIVGLLCFVGSLVCILYPSVIIKLLSGKEYVECINLARLFAISMTFFALMYTLLFYQLSINRSGFIYPLIFFTVLQNILIILFHKDLSQVLYILCATAILLCAINLKMSFRKYKG